MDEFKINAKPSRRIIAYLVDLCLILAVSLILFIPTILALVNVNISQTTLNIFALMIASLFSGAMIVSFMIFYFVCLPVFWDGQTIGKRLFNITIIDTTTGEGPNAKTMFIREATRIFLFLFTVGLSAVASLIVLLVSEKHLVFHEILSSTKVVNINVYKEETANDLN